MKNEMNQEDFLKKALKEYGGEDPGQQFTFSVMDKVMAEQRKQVKVKKPLLGWWFWGSMAAMLATLAGLAIFTPGSGSAGPASGIAGKITSNEYVGAVQEKLPEIGSAISSQTFLWFGLIALGALFFMDRVMRNRRRAV
jgi:hypothetical protein